MRLTKEARGFTLIELLVVLVIVLLLAAVAMPNLIQEYRLTKIRTASRDWREMAVLGRATAILQHTPVLLKVDLEQHRFLLEKQPGTEHDASGLILHREYAESVGVHLEFSGRSADKKGMAVRFEPDGTCDDVRVVFTQKRTASIGVQLNPITAASKVLMQ